MPIKGKGLFSLSATGHRRGYVLPWNLQKVCGPSLFTVSLVSNRSSETCDPEPIPASWQLTFSPTSPWDREICVPFSSKNKERRVLHLTVCIVFPNQVYCFFLWIHFVKWGETTHCHCSLCAWIIPYILSSQEKKLFTSAYQSKKIHLFSSPYLPFTSKPDWEVVCVLLSHILLYYRNVVWRNSNICYVECWLFLASTVTRCHPAPHSARCIHSHPRWPITERREVLLWMDS